MAVKDSSKDIASAGTISKKAQNPTTQEPKGRDAGDSTWNGEVEVTPIATYEVKPSSLPFGQPIALDAISGPTYVTTQVLVQQVAYILSDKIFSYSSEAFDLDFAAKQWSAAEIANATGYVTQVASMQTRSGAGAIALGYMFSKDFDMSRRHIPQSMLATPATLQSLRPVLDQLTLLYSVANPFVGHISAVDYAADSLVTDYATTMHIADDLCLGLVCSRSTYEGQHMAILSTLMASVLPTLHTYDGLYVGQDTARVVDTYAQHAVHTLYERLSAKGINDQSKVDTETRITQLLENLNSELGTDYGLFEYHGSKTPSSVMVIFGSVEASLAVHAVEGLAQTGHELGVINVRVYRPFNEAAFLKILASHPTIARITVLGQVLDRISVADQSIHSALYEDVLAATAFTSLSTASALVLDHKYARSETFTLDSMADILLATLIQNTSTTRRELSQQTPVETYTFWDTRASRCTAAPYVIGQLLSGDSSYNVTLSQTQNDTIRGGMSKVDVRRSKKSIEAPYAVSSADVAYVGDELLLTSIDIVESIRNGGRLVVRLPGCKNEDIEKRIPERARSSLHTRQIALSVYDPLLSSSIEENPDREVLALELIQLQVMQSPLLTHGLDKLADLNGSSELLGRIRDELGTILREVEVPLAWGEIAADADQIKLPRGINITSFTGCDMDELESPSLLNTWQTAAKGLLFKEAYGTKSALRPDLSVKTYEVTVKENRRLTPATYDRNIFHIEFDLGDSGLKYEIGEALGIHAENNREEVEEFIRWYGLDPEALVELPSRDDEEGLDTRTVYQSLIHNIDIFGKPPKRFYEALAEFATSAQERKNLLTLAGPEGVGEFKRRAEVDTVTYADILQEFPSAKPTFHDLARIVSPLKRREYSIASSQAVSPTTLALMIVVVSWVDPRGRDRFGQATKYLSNLPIGAKLTVSVKPSVMKLPAQSTAPLIMAGLGTGLAPFRAFVQYRAMQKAQGLPIGEILLYMGSRHQREEYLYGEEWEAYQDAGVITLLGRAFSRDQPRKIYIQDRMRESLQDIVRAYCGEEGAFYLCGPTWPVPDVTKVLEEAVSMDAQNKGLKRDAAKQIERLKDAGRFVLEVY